ncbi:MAG: KH domain-containing protein [Synergistaceae bacterium]|jgi:spoIIIJ-associated protein|nr:KH domain-containing protein [Synergistaceae bacterium]
MERTEPLVVETDSIENAVLDAARNWKILPEDVQVRILEEGKRFLGFFARKTRVELFPSGDLEILKAKSVLSGILQQMGMDVEVRMGEEEVLNITGADAGIVIGRYGETLKALEYLLNLIYREGRPSRPIRLDSDGYRERREENLKRIALASAREALRRRRPVTMEPMTSWERRVVHLALKDHLEVDTRSVGDEPQRRVVIWPRSGSRQKNRLN